MLLRPEAHLGPFYFFQHLWTLRPKRRFILSRLYFAARAVPFPMGFASFPMEGGNMRVSLKAITLSSAILWGGAMLCVGLIHMADRAYGGDFLRIMSSVYPGADTTPTLGRVLLGTLYGFVDGGVAGFLFGWLYGAFSEDARVLSK